MKESIPPFGSWRASARWSNAGDADTLRRNADRAQYWAKESGRNMTFVYTDEARSTLSDHGALDELKPRP